MKRRERLLYLTIVVDTLVGFVLYVIFDSWRIGVGVAGVMLALDLKFLPVILPDMFRDDEE